MAKTFGCCRFVYNYYLDKRMRLYKESKTSFGFKECCKDLTELKKKNPWLCEPDKCSLQNALRDLDTAYVRFYKGLGNFPKFKTKRTHRYSYRTQNYNKGKGIRICGNRIKLPKLGWVRIRDKRFPTGLILNATISQFPDGRYYVSLCCDEPDSMPMPKTYKNIGIDLGIKYYIVTDDGSKYENPKYLDKSLSKLSRLQKELSRKSIGSSNWDKSRLRLARLYSKISNQRDDYINKLSKQFIIENDIICVEDLVPHNLVKNRCMSKNIIDASWSKFVHQLQYKAEWYGKKVVKVDKFFPSSQLCSDCGYKNKDLRNLNVRVWTCPSCGVKHDRDVNAAKNILYRGISQLTL